MDYQRRFTMAICNHKHNQWQPVKSRLIMHKTIRRCFNR